MNSNINNTTHLSCVNEDNYSNIILPTKISKIINNEKYDDNTLTTLLNNYKNICKRNNGNVELCCRESNLPISEYDSNLINKFKKKFNIKSIKVERDDNKNINKILISKNIEKDNGWTENISPYIICKILNNKFKKTENPDILETQNINIDCYNNMNVNEGNIITIEHLLKENPKKFNLLSTQNEDINLVKTIKNKELNYLKDYIFKYKNIVKPLNHDDNNNTIMHICVMENFITGVNLLLSLSSSNLDEILEARNKYLETPLILAIKHNNLEIANILLVTGANINSFNINKENALFYAIKNNNYNALLLLFNNNIDIFRKNNNNNNLIQYSIINNPNIKIINFLLNRGISITEKNNDGKTAFDLINEKENDFKNNSLNNNYMKKLINNNDNNDNNHINKINLTKYNMPKELIIIQSIYTLLRNTYNLDKYSNNNVIVNENSITSPIYIDNLICYKDIENIEDKEFGKIIPNVSNEKECKDKGGYPIYNKKNNKNMKVEFQIINKNDIDSLDDKDLYKPKCLSRSIIRDPNHVQYIPCKKNNDSSFEEFINSKNKILENFETKKCEKEYNKRTKLLLFIIQIFICIILFILINYFVKNK